MMECNVVEALRNNVFGLINLLMLPKKPAASVFS